MQHLILLIVLLITVGLIYTVTKWKGGLHMTFSQHAATNRLSKVFYSLLFLITMPLLMVFFAVWLVPAKNLPNTFLWFAAVAVFFQILCTWIPEVGGRRTTVHRILTGISAVAILPLIVILATSPHHSVLVQSITWISFVIMTVLLIIALMNQKGYRYALLLQIGYYTLFFIIILVATYL